LGALVLTGCSNSADDATPSDHLSAEGQLLVDDAARAGASDEQLGELREYGLTGEVSFEVVRGAVARATECFEDAGLTYFVEQDNSGAGVPYMYYGWSAGAGQTDDQGRDLGDACNFGESAFIEAAFQQQASSQAIRDTAFLRFREELVRCLRAYGAVILDEPTKDEVLQASRDLAASGATTGLECMPPD